MDWTPSGARGFVTSCEESLQDARSAHARSETPRSVGHGVARRWPWGAAMVPAAPQAAAVLVVVRWVAQGPGPRRTVPARTAGRPPISRS